MADRLPRQTDQPPLIQALLRPETYPHPAGDIRLHETHISWVLLAGDYAYKLKKPLDLGFLDFSTLASRRKACDDEVRLNRRLCPDVYLGVVDVREREGSYFVGGPGRTVEPAVRMRRMPEEGMLPELLNRDAVTPALVRRIARRLARFHASAVTGPGVDEHGSPAAVTAAWWQNFAQVQPYIGRTLAPEAFRHTLAFVESFLGDQASLLERRAAGGRVRDGHGDLHAASVCVEGRRLHFFDCIEFNVGFRCTDVAAEVAFLAMDLEHYGRADVAAAYVDAYVAASGDHELRQLLAFYECYRAFVRGKVTSFRLDQPGLDGESAARLTAEARAYFDLAWAHAGGLPSPLLVASMGLPASGKTTLARALSGRLGLVHLESDVIRKELAGLPPTARVGGVFGKGLYDPAMTRRTYARVLRRAARWLRRGYPVVVDATFGDPAQRAALRRLAARVGARFVVLVCQADEETAKRRLAARAGRADTASDARLDLWPALRAAFVPRHEMPEAAMVDTTRPPEEAVERAMEAIRA